METTLPNGVKITVDQAKPPVKVRMKEDSFGKNDLKLEKGKTYELPDDSAHFQVRLGRADYVDEDGQVKPPVVGVAGAVAPASVLAQEAAGAQQQVGYQLEDVDGDTLTVAELKDRLQRAGVEFDSTALKADLVKAYGKAVKAQAKA